MGSSGGCKPLARQLLEPERNRKSETPIEGENEPVLTTSHHGAQTELHHSSLERVAKTGQPTNAACCRDYVGLFHNSAKCSAIGKKEYSTCAQSHDCQAGPSPRGKRLKN